MDVIKNEWRRLVGHASDVCLSKSGAKLVNLLCDESQWAGTVHQANVLQDETREAKLLIERKSIWSVLLDLAEPDEALEILRSGKVLSVSELFLLKQWLDAISMWNEIPRADLGKHFSKSLSDLMNPTEALRSLTPLFTSDGQLSENATPELNRLTRAERNQRLEIDRQLAKLIERFRPLGVLQEDFTDVRDGRFVLPVKMSHQPNVHGRVHGTSVTKQTAFIEPAEIEPLNQTLQDIKAAVQREVYRILSEATAVLRPLSEHISGSIEILSYWDSVQAKARVSLAYGGVSIEVTEERYFETLHTAHPLLFWSLERSKIVRNSLEINAPFRALMITGPNAGGKSVLLKTVATAAACARTGFFLPGEREHRVPFFDRIFADIGDAQSIEEHLSSFSAHVERFKVVHAEATDKSLVILDELNSATDPQEGAALCRAFIETLLDRGDAMIVATTHDPHLKTIASSDQRILNASMQFDEEKYVPTYRVLMGLPGRSRAIETAERLGLHQEIITRAKGYLSEGHVRFESLIQRWETEVATARSARVAAEKSADESERLKQKWKERVETQVETDLGESRKKLRQILALAEEEIRDKVRELQRKPSQESVRRTKVDLAEVQSRTAQRVEEIVNADFPEIAISKAPPVKTAEISVGDMVSIPKWKRQGRVESIDGKKVKVLPFNGKTFSGFPILVDREDIELLDQKAFKEKVKPKKTTMSFHELEHVGPELDLRGERFEAAMSRFEIYIDRAYGAGYSQVTIIHGVGTGALREGVKSLLASKKFVKSHRDGEFGEGGAGVTMIFF